jgi:hypothetical protein
MTDHPDVNTRLCELLHPDDEVRRLREVADAAESLRDSNRVGLFNLVLRDERRLDLALDALRVSRSSS